MFAQYLDFNKMKILTRMFNLIKNSRHNKRKGVREELTIREEKDNSQVTDLNTGVQNKRWAVVPQGKDEK